LIELLEIEGVRSNYKVMVGGGQTTQEWADRIGADGYGKNAQEAVKVAANLMDQTKK
jgi:methanogenic corrinoid protein MtbC1